MCNYRGAILTILLWLIVHVAPAAAGCPTLSPTEAKHQDVFDNIAALRAAEPEFNRRIRDLSQHLEFVGASQLEKEIGHRLVIRTENLESAFDALFDPETGNFNPESVFIMFSFSTDVLRLFDQFESKIALRGGLKEPPELKILVDLKADYIARQHKGIVSFLTRLGELSTEANCGDRSAPNAAEIPPPGQAVISDLKCGRAYNPILALRAAAAGFRQRAKGLFDRIEIASTVLVEKILAHRLVVEAGNLEGGLNSFPHPQTCVVHSRAFLKLGKVALDVQIALGQLEQEIRLRSETAVKEPAEFEIVHKLQSEYQSQLHKQIVRMSSPRRTGHI